jgi:methyltransferase (TIGR00027 family)
VPKTSGNSLGICFSYDRESDCEVTDSNDLEPGSASADTPRRASNTAYGVAVLRAAHRIIDAEPFVLDDPVAVRLLAPDIEEQIRTRAAELQTPATRGLRSHVLLRSRYAEDSLRSALEGGVRQYVLLGAGLDTFAYRQPSWASALTIVEVDHPASQAAKRRALTAAGIDIPRNVRYADVDFEHESLAAGLARCGVITTRPTFFSWLGVTMYLTRDAIEGTLRTVLSFAKRSEIVFTFAQPNPGAGSASASFAAAAASAGEPWTSYFTPEEIERMLRLLGFSSVRFLSRDEAVRRYYDSRTDDLSAPSRVSIVRAVV